MMAIALCLGRLIGDARAGDRRMLGAIVAGSFVALVGANFAYLYPILAEQVDPVPAVAGADVVQLLDLIGPDCPPSLPADAISSGETLDLERRGRS